MNKNEMRLQKFMSQSWVCSRRKAEEYIEQWLVKVNGEIAKIWDKIDTEKDEVIFHDKLIEDIKNYVYFKINKPRGVVTTCKQEWDTWVIDIIDIPLRVFPIGRLDKNTTGLLILTNDGRLSHRLMHPSFEHEKEYVVEVFWPIEDGQLKTLSKGVKILNTTTKSCKVERISSGTFSIVLKEGKNRQIRRMVEAIGLRVKKLKRIRIENVLLGKIHEWGYKELTGGEKKELLSRVGLSE